MIEGRESPTSRRILVAASLVTLVAAGLALRVSLAWKPVETMVARFLGDDAFYYFQIARNIASGHGSTFDGFSTTNGYHPLWMIVCIAAYRMFGAGGSDLPIHAILTFGALLDVLTGLVIFAILKRFAGAPGALLGSGLYLLNPIVALMANCGVELPLQTFLLTVYLFLFVRLVHERSPRRPRFSLSVWLGIVSGLLLLARTDNALIVGPILVWMAWPQRSRPFRAAVVIALPLIVVAPWIVWNLRTFGTVVQDSAFAISTIKRAGMGAGAVQMALQHVKDLVGLVSFWVPTYSGSLYAICLLIGVVLGVRMSGAAAPLESNARSLIIGLGMVAGLFVCGLCVHVLIRLSVRPWYVTPLAMFTALFAGAVFQQLLDRAALPPAPRYITAATVALVFLAAVTVPNARYLKIGFWPHGAEMYAMAGRMKERLAESDRVGAFNAGILGYYSCRTVVNLDGLVNHEIHTALRPGRLPSYLERERIRYIADDHETLQLYRPFLSRMGSGEANSPLLQEIDAIRVQDGYWPTPGIALMTVDQEVGKTAAAVGSDGSGP